MPRPIVGSAPAITADGVPMTTEQLSELIREALGKKYTNATTLRVYRGGAARILARIPIDLFGDERVIRTYRQLLSDSNKGIFGTVWRIIHDVMTFEAGLPCVDPERLAYSLRLPSMIAYSAEILAMASSYAAVAQAKWGDLKSINGQVFLGRYALGNAQTIELRRLATYFWADAEPARDAPILALSRLRNLVPLPAQMVEDAVKDLDAGASATRMEEWLAYRLYNAMSESGQWSIQKIDEYLSDLEGIAEFKRGGRKNAHASLEAAIKAIKSGNVAEVNRLWTLAVAGKKGSMASSPPVSWANSTPLPSRNWSVALYVADPSKRG